MPDKLQTYYQQIITGLGEDIHRDGLIDTPKRAAKAMSFLTRGYHQSLEEIVNGAVFESNNDPLRTSHAALYWEVPYWLSPSR